MKKLMIFLLIVTGTANAGIVRIYKGSVAPYSGSLTDSKTMRKIRVELIEKDAYKAQNTSLEKSLKLHQLNADITEKHINMLSKSGDQLADRLSKDTSFSSIERILWFGAGIIATGFALKSAQEMMR